MWRIVKPRLAGREADGRAYGTASIAAWPYEPQQAECPECGSPVPRPRRTQPLAIEWLTDQPLELGDFTWVTGTYWPLLQQALAAELRERFAGFEPGPVEVSELRIRASEMKPGAKLPEPFLARAERLVELWVTKEYEPEPGSAIRELKPPCPGCGLTIMLWGESSPALEILMKGPRGLTVLDRISVSAEKLGDAGFFTLTEAGRHFLLCTDAAKEFLEERGTTNLAFLEAGELVA